MDYFKKQRLNQKQDLETRADMHYAHQVGQVNAFIENLYNLYDGQFPAEIENLVFEIVSKLDDKRDERRSA